LQRLVDATTPIGPRYIGAAPDFLERVEAEPARDALLDHIDQHAAAATGSSSTNIKKSLLWFEVSGLSP
jgi:hypothetical protein